jgi:hypothetical protein
LIKRCIIFDEFMRERRKLGIDVATKEDIQAFVDSTKGQRPDVNNCLRAVSLYYRFRSKPELSALASKLGAKNVISQKDLCIERLQRSKP